VALWWPAPQPDDPNGGPGRLIPLPHLERVTRIELPLSAWEVHRSVPSYWNCNSAARVTCCSEGRFGQGSTCTCPVQRSFAFSLS